MGWNGLPCPPPGVRFPTSVSNPVLLNLGRWILLPLRQLGSHYNYHCDHFNNPLQLTRASPSISFASPTWISYTVNRSTWALLNIILKKKKKSSSYRGKNKTKQKTTLKPGDILWPPFNIIISFVLSKGNCCFVLFLYIKFTYFSPPLSYCPVRNDLQNNKNK